MKSPRRCYVLLALGVALACLLGQAVAVAGSGPEPVPSSPSVGGPGGDGPAGPGRATSPRVRTNIMSEGFEGDWPPAGGLWRVYDADGATNGEYRWDDNSFSYHAGAKSAWPAGGGANGFDPADNLGEYPEYLDSWMVYGPFDLSGYTAAEFDFYYWMQTEAGFDNFWWLASGTSTFTDDDGTYESGDSGGWKYQVVDLSAHVGDSSVWIAFRFTSNEEYLQGAIAPFVDDVGIWGYPPPANDEYLGATEIVGAPFSTTQDTTYATTGAFDPTFACVSGQRYRTVWFTYTAPAAQLLEISTLGSDYDTVLAVWTGPVDGLASAACNDDYGLPQSLVQVAASADTTYRIEVAAATTAGGQLILNLTAVPPGAFGKTWPADGATETGLGPSLSWEAAEGATSYEYCLDTTDDNACDYTYQPIGDTSAPQANLDYSTTYYWQVRAVNGAGVTYADGGAWWDFTTFATTLETFYSTAGFDGWVQESEESSGTGNALDAGSTLIVVGDDSMDRQYRAILDFDTSALPDDAEVVGVTLRVKRQSFTGKNPILTHGLLKVDIKKGFFHGVQTLEKFDFKAPGSRGNVGRFIRVMDDGWYRAPLRWPSYGLIDLEGTTQFRLRFDLDDNDNGRADYLSLFSGNAFAPADRPQLIVEYYVP